MREAEDQYKVIEEATDAGQVIENEMKISEDKAQIPLDDSAKSFASSNFKSQST